MSEIRTLVIFESSAFSTSERKDYFINDCCYGDDVGRWLIEQIRSTGLKSDSEPSQEDWGWWLGFRVGNVDYRFLISHRPADGRNPATWIGWVERKVGLVRSIFGAQKRGIEPESIRVIHSALSSSPLIRNIRWHHQRDFDSLNENAGQTDPLAA